MLLTVFYCLFCETIDVTSKFYYKHAGSGFPGSGSMEMASGWGGGGGGGWGSAAFGATPLPAGSEFAQQAFYQQLMVRVLH